LISIGFFFFFFIFRFETDSTLCPQDQLYMTSSAHCPYLPNHPHLGDGYKWHERWMLQTHAVVAMLCSIPATCPTQMETAAARKITGKHKPCTSPAGPAMGLPVAALHLQVGVLI
jgi:hypothetical protein